MAQEQSRCIRHFADCLVAALLMLFAVSCASLQIATEPSGAELTLISTAGGAPVNLGKAPQQIGQEQLGQLLKQGPIIIRANAEGFEAVSLLVPTSLRGDLKASLTLKKIEQKDSDEKRNGELNSLVRDILDAERGIIEKRYDDAQRISVKIREKFPSLAISYFLEGSIQFQKGDTQAAIASLNRGIELDPNDTVTRNFIEQIKSAPAKTK